MTQALAHLNAALIAAFGAEQVVVDRVLHRSPQALVAAGVADDRPVIVKQFLGPDMATAVARLAEAHDSIAPHLAQGPFRLAPLLRLEAGLGLAVMGQAPGQRMDAVLGRAAAAERGAVMQLAGGWLAAFAAPRLERARTNLHSVIRRRKEHEPPALPEPDRALTGTILAAMRAQARALADTPLNLSGVHGDLTPYNLHIAAAEDGLQLWGFDLQPPRLRPVAQDAAQFLVVAGLRLPPAPGPMRDGLPAADAATFLAACPAVEPAALRFFIADRLLRALHDAPEGSPRAASARAALRHWLEEAPCP